jgi:hypothetical protein
MSWCGTLCIWHSSSKHNTQCVVFLCQNSCMHVTRHVFLCSSTLTSITYNTLFCMVGSLYLWNMECLLIRTCAFLIYSMILMCWICYSHSIQCYVYVGTHTCNTWQVCYIHSMWHAGPYIKTFALIKKKGDYVLVSYNNCLGQWNCSLLLLNGTA